MLKIRLSRIGRKNLPSFRVVVVPANTKRETKFVEDLGFYSPLTKKYEINKDRALYWISVGAQPTDIVESLLQRLGYIEKVSTKKFNDKPGKKKLERESKKN